MYGMLLGGAGVSQSIRNFVGRTLLFSSRFVYYGVPNSRLGFGLTCTSTPWMNVFTRPAYLSSQNIVRKSRKRWKRSYRGSFAVWGAGGE